jgi:hypothetical protein
MRVKMPSQAVYATKVEIVCTYNWSDSTVDNPTAGNWTAFLMGKKHPMVLDEFCIGYAEGGTPTIALENLIDKMEQV